MAEPLVSLRNVHMVFQRSKGIGRGVQRIYALTNVNLDIHRGEVLAVVGESGCGKTTLGKIILGLYRPTAGDVLYKGKRVGGLTRTEWETYRRAIQWVQQDAFAATNPTQTVERVLTTPLVATGNARQAGDKIREALALVGLSPPEQFLRKFPHQLSGGQRQRVVIARALLMEPELIVADEPVSMVDVSFRLSILQLMRRLNEEKGISFVYITHDLATARYIAHGGRIAVMYLGHIVEYGPLGRALKSARHPYLQALLAAVPVPDPKAARNRRELPLRGTEVGQQTAVPVGCPFASRCPYALDRCTRETPELRPFGEERVACHLAESTGPWQGMDVAVD